MNVEFFPTNTMVQRLDNMLPDMTDGSYEVIAVEIFDHETSRFSEELGTDIGPFVVGRTEDVYAWLDANGYEEFETQCSAGNPAPDPSGDA